MEGNNFTGKFQKPKETFTVQHFNHDSLNRIAPEILVGLVVVVVVALVIHFFIAALPDARKRRERQ